MDVVVGDDGIPRCGWGGSTPEYQSYHDMEWGRPVGDDARVFEKLCLEGFQSGLSWLTILRKRAAFQAAFAGFEPGAVADFDDRDVERLLADAGIVRHRGKILAAIGNARATVGLQEKGISLAGVAWSHQPDPGPPPETLADLLSATAESTALSAELRGYGFRFVGPTTVYAAMQSLGVVNDHLSGCGFRAEAERDRKRFRVPSR
jgi:DNA-3-methyladenine glycosylase I